MNQLTDESGPAHKKTFTVCLLVGDEEYIASGPSIKKAQHAAAAIALEKTKLKHPPPKQRVAKNRESAHQGGSRRTISLTIFSFAANVTPTVELNALAMKMGEATTYTFLESTPSAPPACPAAGRHQQTNAMNNPLILNQR